MRARPARDPAERGIVLSRDPGAYATERGVKMADEEAEQERLSRGGGGCVAELQRLGERLQELERQLRESRVPAVEAATEYCQQLCQVRAPGGPLPLFPSQRGKRASERLGAERWSSLLWHRWRRRPGGSGEYEEGAFV